MRTIGTAGHVDHGKSTLVQRLTGIDPDRLAEEKAREMTIDLGFAWMPLRSGEMLGIVDVPGHRDFIENMLAGVGGIDAALLIIAADEGIMPQTREHLAILNLLDIRSAIVVITKIDLIDDPQWLELIEAEIADALSSTALANAPMVQVSALTGTGMAALRDTIEQLVTTLPPRVETGLPRLPIDRVFSMAGFGTVVTGTLHGGALRLGDEVELLPGGKRARVRSLQSYQQPVERALSGSRVAVNLAGLDREEVRRGQVIAYPGTLTQTTRLDIHFRHLPEASRPLRHNVRMKLFTGTSETVARVRVLGAEHIATGETGWLQLETETPLALTRGDRVILRHLSPGETVGGGVVVDPMPGSRWRRFRPDVLAALEMRLRGTPAEQLVQLAGGDEPLKRAALQQASGWTESDFAVVLQQAIEQGLLVVFPGDTYLSAARARLLLAAIEDELTRYHREQPLRPGMAREELRSRLGVRQATLAALLNSSERFVSEDTLVRLHDHEVTFSGEQQRAIAQLQAQMEAAPFTPPSFAEAAAVVGEDVLNALIDLGGIVRVQPDVIFSRSSYDVLVEGALRMIDEQGQVTAAGLRDAYGTSRKYAIGLLEYLDAQKITRRVGDARVRR